MGILDIFKKKSTDYYENGQKMSEGIYYYGREFETGSETEWYENGQKKSEMTIKDYETDGLLLQWYENGQKKLESIYKSGHLVKLIGRWNEDGSVRKEPFSYE
jgi:antitoxin component YwqK of YwqJK toxin-antitoxin module